MKVKINLMALAVAATLSWGCSSKSQQQDEKKKVEAAAKKEQAKKQKKDIRQVKLKPETAEEILLEYGASVSSNEVLLKTTKGDIKIRLYEGTPIHRANFLMLTERNFYDESLFYRVMKDFMIQGGDSDDLKFRGKKRRIGKYKLPAEFQTEKYFHKRGAVAMAREYEKNPEKQSSVYEFYIVQAHKPLTALELQGVSEEYGITFTEAQRKAYTTVGGAPHLDGEHTVFGEVVEGMSVVDSIANIPVGKGSWPINNVIVNQAIIINE